MRRRATKYRGRSRPVAYMPVGVPDDQLWFWTEAWQRGERRASRDIRKHQTHTFTDGPTFFASLLGTTPRPWKVAR